MSPASFIGIHSLLELITYYGFQYFLFSAAVLVKQRTAQLRNSELEVQTYTHDLQVDFV